MCNRSSVSGPYLPPAFFSVSVSAVCVTFQQQELENSFRKGSLPEPSHISVGTGGLGKVSTVKFSGAYQTYQLQVKGFAGYFFKC